MTRVLLDVLVPAYKQPEGVENIVRCFKDDSRVRVIVSDDSASQSDKSLIRKVCEEYGAIYLEGPHKGAAENWNSLLKLVTSEFFLLVHHDEYFSCASFVDCLESGSVTGDVLVMPVMVVNKKGVSRFVRSWLQKILIFSFRRYGPMLNLVGGPTACLIVRRESMQTFDTRLVYQIDCEWYSQIFKNISYSKICFFDRTQVISRYNSSSITRHIASELKVIVSNDVAFLEDSPWQPTIKRWKKIGWVIELGYKACLLPSFIPFMLRNWLRVRG